MVSFWLPGDSIVSRLLKTAFGAYVLIAVTIVLIEVWSNYGQTRERIALSLHETQSLVDSGLANAVWYVDQPLQVALLEGLIKRSEVEAVRLLDAEGNLLHQAGNERLLDSQPDNLGDLRHQFPLFKPQDWSNGDSQVIAQMELFSSSEIVWLQMQPIIMGMIMAATLKASALWIIFLYFGWRMVSLPLQDLREFVLGRGKKRALLSPKAENEIEALDRSIRIARDKSERALNDKVDEINTLLKNAEVELHRERLSGELDLGYKWELCLETLELRADQTLSRWMGLEASETNTYPASKLFEMVLPEWRASLIEVIQTSAEQTAANPNYTLLTEHPLIRRDIDKVIWVKVVGKVIEIDGRTLIVGSASDVSEQIQYQSELKTMLENQQRLAEKQKEMFAIIGHELRTPVAAISMITVDDSTAVDDRIDQISDISSHLLAVLDDLRVVVAPERALESKLQTGDLVNLVRRAISPLANYVKKQGMMLHVTLPQNLVNTFSFHEQPLRQSVTNLVKNAALHSEGHNIYLSLKYEFLGTEGVRAQLRVEDDGVGIPELGRANIFEPFCRGNTNKDGSGLGLFIVKQMADLMGGELVCSRSAYGGACFDLYFKMARLEMNPSASASDIKVSLDGVKILFAEDDLTIRLLTERILRSKGAIVSSFENGKLALDAFLHNQFDLIFTDLMMPEMNGEELTTAIRETGSKIPIVGCTAAVLGNETEQLILEGANIVIPKPITADRLIDVLTEINFSRRSEA
ncbi:MAG TPA: hybrid sensor histidine kinase/response regulator [Marinobacterium sp.]|nr:hybrid sensor histidine kinase/response regulator [Marinobacterium sp.]